MQWEYFKCLEETRPYKLIGLPVESSCPLVAFNCLLMQNSQTGGEARSVLGWLSVSTLGYIFEVFIQVFLWCHGLWWICLKSRPAPCMAGLNLFRHSAARRVRYLYYWSFILLEPFHVSQWTAQLVRGEPRKKSAMLWLQQAEDVGVKWEYFPWDHRTWAKMEEPTPWWGGVVPTKLKLAVRGFTCGRCLRMLPGEPDSLLSHFVLSPLSKQIMTELWVHCLSPSLFYQCALNRRDKCSGCLF